MAKETRSGRGSYVTRSRRVGRRVERTYFGTGPAADLAVAMDGLQKLAAEKHTAWWRREHELFAELENEIGPFYEKTAVLVRLTLLRNGFRKHPTKWRFTQMAYDAYQPTGKVLDTEQFKWALEKAEEGDPEALASVRRTMRETGMWEEAWRDAIRTTQMMIATMTNADPILTIALNDRTDGLRSKWNGDSPTKLIRLLVERLVLAWLAALHSQSFGQSVRQTILSKTQRNAIEQRKRDAMKQLRLAKKLLRLIQKDLPAAIQRRENRLQSSHLQLANFEPPTD